MRERVLKGSDRSHFREKNTHKMLKLQGHQPSVAINVNEF